MADPADRSTRRTDRGARRRHAIVAAAAELFAEHGYPAVGMDDIGAAAGVTGPAIYRHFESKAAVLAAVIDGIIDAVDVPGTDIDAAGGHAGGPGWPDNGGPGPADAGAATRDQTDTRAATRDQTDTGAATRDQVDTGPATRDGAVPRSPARALAGQVAHYAAAVAERRGLMAVFVREVHHLPAEHAQRLRHRQRDLVARWRWLLARVHPDWPDERVRTAVHAVFGMLNAVGTFSSPLDDAELADQLTELACAALELAAP